MASVASVRVRRRGGRDIPGVSEFCGSEVAKCTALETTKRSEVGELVEHRGAVLHIINPHITLIKSQKAWNISKTSKINALWEKSF